VRVRSRVKRERENTEEKPSGKTGMVGSTAPTGTGRQVEEPNVDF